MKTPEFIVDLSAPPEDRWNDMLSDPWAIETSQRLIANEWEQAADYLVLRTIGGFILPKAWDWSSGNSGYKEELEAWAKVTGAEYKKYVMANLSYELSQLCSSVALQSKKLGMVHARNLDWPIDGKATCIAHFECASAGPFSAVTFPGFIGVLSGIAKGRFSATINQAPSTEKNLLGGFSVAFMLRSIFERAKDYKSALSMLRKFTPLAPVYVMLVGVKKDEAAIVELMPKSPNRVCLMENDPLVLTNHDQGSIEPEDSDSMNRWIALSKWTSDFEPNSFESVGKIMLREPVKNDNTCQSMVLHPLTGKIVLKTYERRKDKIAPKREAKSQGITAYEKSQVKAIELWKQQEPSVVSKGLGFAAKPVVYLINKIVPQKAIEGALTFSNTAAKYFTDTKDILRDGKVSKISELQKKDMKVSDEMADVVHNWAIGVATAEGGGTGWAGAPSLAFDIPFLLTHSLRTIHKIGLCYGYECDTREDQNFCFGVLSASGANTIEEKAGALLTLRTIEVMIARQTWKALAEKAAAQNLSKEAAVIAIRNLAKQLGINITKRKALEAIPGIGALVGASVNGWFLREVGWSARRAFQERWLIDNHKVFEI